MTAPIYRNATSAWNALQNSGCLDLDERDDDLVGKLRDRLDGQAPDLDHALSNATTDELMSALFSVIQPFVGMFQDILAFFEKAGAHNGQSQWRISVGEEFLDLRHFEEFLEHWSAIDADLEVPALDRSHAFFLNDARAAIGGWDYLVEGMEYGKIADTGIRDVDDWLAAYDAGQYALFPPSLMPSKFPPGLADAAAILLAAVTILRQRGLSREEMLAEHRARGYRSVDDDALHPWTIAQSETDYWLRSHVGYLANILQRPASDIEELAALTSEKLAPFPRRRVPGRIEIKEIERLLSLPVWRQRYETYGVWIAALIAGSLEDHELNIHADAGQLRFSFNEAKIVDVVSTRPMRSVFAERRVELANPVGKSRTGNVQPDFSIWAGEEPFSDCVLVVEVKHYKKRSRRNFEEALIDYARAHPRAKVALVNYGPVGKEFDKLPDRIGDRAKMLGPLTPETYQTLEAFRELIKDVVGPPVPRLDDSGGGIDPIVALDVSGSMRAVLTSEEFFAFLGRSSISGAMFVLIDQDVRAKLSGNKIERWLAENELGNATSLAEPMATLLAQYSAITLITDESGLQSLSSLRSEILKSPLSDIGVALVARVTR
ncbi:hypothetical protein [Novosphingobium sp. BW1]|uniref:hypothetical protein n=1 Tax=Novosphingobium sp. BW1 TaxID=2592621 RepID=UPI0011DE87B2|nr:hypothetical protein [Novosphingobium sp. BW1]TYC78784.1 hypothetical protein FMM79_20780 [Novosphingobium sp. BW1]